MSARRPTHKQNLLQKRNLGRSDFPVDVVAVEELASIGLTLTEISYLIGLSPSSVYGKIRKQNETDGYSEIHDAFTRGKAKNAKLYLQALQSAALEQKNVAAIIFNLKAHHGRRENDLLSVEDHPSVAVQALTPEQRRLRIAELQSKTIEAEVVTDDDDTED